MTGRTLAPGEAEGEALVLLEPLSLWGGLDPSNGQIIDPRHPQHGATVTDRVLVMPSGRGSSSSSTVLAEAIRARTAPAAIVLAETDAIIALGSIVASELYDRAIPVITWTGDVPDGRVRIRTTGPVAMLETI